MVNDHYPYEMAISLGILTQHFQTNSYIIYPPKKDQKGPRAKPPGASKQPQSSAASGVPVVQKTSMICGFSSEKMEEEDDDDDDDLAICFLPVYCVRVIHGEISYHVMGDFTMNTMNTTKMQGIFYGNNDDTSICSKC